MERTHGFCPNCNEESAIDSRGACLWCGTSAAPQPPKGRYKRRVDTFLSDDHLRKLHRLHFDGGYSIRELGKRIYEPAGYSSWNSAARAIARGFHRLHLPIRHYDGRSPASESRRCEEPGCGGFKLEGERVCWSHHDDNRPLILRNIGIANAARLEVPA